MMKVKDLIGHLSKLDPNLDIYGYTEDLNLASDDSPYHVFSIESMDVSVVETERDIDGRPIIKFSDLDQESSRKVAFINLYTDF